MTQHHAPAADADRGLIAALEAIVENAKNVEALCRTIVEAA